MSLYTIHGLEFMLGGKRYGEGSQIELPDRDAKKFARWLKPAEPAAETAPAAAAPAKKAKEPKP